MTIVKGVINLIDLERRIRKLERAMAERGEHILDDVRQRRLETIKSTQWQTYIMY